MNKTQCYFCAFFLTTALAAPVAMLAAPTPQEAAVQIRVFDRNHKDYHNWDDHENHSWGVYLTNKHKKQVEFSKSSKREQSHYWNWRHSHPDKD